MNIDSNHKIKIVVTISLIIFSMNSTYPQKNKACINVKYDEQFVLMMKETVQFNDSLTLTLTDFSHKRPYRGGPTKATAYITVEKDGIQEEITLSIHGREGKSPENDGLNESERYDTLQWNEYVFKLKEFLYDRSIELIVDKAK